MTKHTVFDGALERRESGWCWTDTGEIEPRVADLRPAQAYNFRVQAGCVQVPVGRAHAEDDLSWIVQEDYKRGPDVDAGLERNRRSAGATIDGDYDHRVRGRDAYYVPLADWDRWCKDTILGATWDRAHESDLLDRARRINEARS